jgi:hypothetical protein
VTDNSADEQTEVVRRICDIWAEALRVEQVRPTHTLTGLGGTSIDGLRLTLMLKRALGVRLAADIFVDNPTPADMAEHLRPLLEATRLT